MSYGMDTADYIDSLKARLAAAEAERDALRAACEGLLGIIRGEYPYLGIVSDATTFAAVAAARAALDAAGRGLPGEGE
jgi:hypothetical protein